MTAPDEQPAGYGATMPEAPPEAPLVSVVTPVHNEECHIEECIESVLGQTYPHWEYTIVDNRSTDRTLAIAHEYADRDARIRVVAGDTFVPIIDSFNNAFRQVSSAATYCKVIGADDWMYPECLGRMVELAEQDPDIAIVGAYWLSGSRVAPTGWPFEEPVVAGPDICRDYLLRERYFPMAPSPLLFRADIVRARQPFYRGRHLHTDAEACFEILQQPHRFGFVPQILTFSRVRNESMTAHARHLNTYIAQRLYLLKSFGPNHLTAAELRERIRAGLAEYYDFLASQVPRRRDRQFWAMHRASLAELGHPLALPRLGLNTVLYGTEELARRLRRKV